MDDKKQTLAILQDAYGMLNFIFIHLYDFVYRIQPVSGMVTFDPNTNPVQQNLKSTPSQSLYNRRQNGYYC